MNDMNEIISNANQLKGKLIEEKKFEEAAQIREHTKNIETSVRALEDILKANGFFWVTEENLVMPDTADDVPDAKDEEFPFTFPATCPYCGARWRFSEQACEHFSIRLNMCTVPETVVICPSCRKRSLITPKGKVKHEDVGDGAGIAFSREGACLKKVD